MITDPFILGVSAAFGMVIGSFLNVCIVRLPREKKQDRSLVYPGSHCPRCGSPILWYDNIPVVSWIVLLGRCRHCRAPISPLYPLIEATVGGIWAAAVWYYGLTLTTVAGATFATILLGIAATDARHYIIPDEFTWGGLAIGLVLSLRNGLAGLGNATVGAVVGFVLLYFVAVVGEKVFGKEAMGGGDIKMLTMIGAFVGWQGVLLTIFLGSFIATIVYVPLTIWKYREVPFGVFLSVAAGTVFVAGEKITRWYFDFLRAA